MIKTHLRLAIAIALLGFTGGAAVAQDVVVRTEVGERDVYVGQDVIFEIVIEGSTNADAPVAPQVNGLEIQFFGTTEEPAPVVIVNGRRIDQGPDKLRLRYRARPLREGDFTVPQMIVEVEGETFRTQSFTVSATEPPESENFELRIDVARTDLYVGEPTLLTITWYLAANPEAFEFRSAFDAADVELDPISPQSAGARNTAQADFDGQRVTGVVGQGRLDGRIYTTFTIEQLLTPNRAGTIEVAPVTVVFDEIVGRRDRGLLFRENVTERGVARSNPLTLNVRPLPTTNRPDDFTGLVGQYSIGAFAEPADVNVGDPIALRAVIAGSPPLSRVEAPSLESIPGFSESFKLSPDGWSANPSSGTSRSFSTTIRAALDTVTEIPPLGLSYFDPELGEYRVAQSDPIPLNVRATREVTAADAIGGGGAPIARHALESAGGGLRANYVSPAALATQRVRFVDRMGVPALAVVGGAPPAVWLGSVLFLAIRRRIDPDARRRAHALRNARTVLRQTRNGADALRRYLADRFDRPIDSLTAYDARALLAPAGGEVAGDAYGVLLGDEGARFGGEDGGAAAVDVESLLTRIDRGLKS